jgi:hypothetical protein
MNENFNCCSEAGCFCEDLSDSYEEFCECPEDSVACEKD